MHGDLFREGGWDQHGAWKLEQLRVGNPIAHLGFFERLASGLVAVQEPSDVEPLLVIETAGDIAHRNDTGSFLFHDEGSVHPDIPKSLNRDRGAINGELEMPKCFQCDIHDPSSRRFFPAQAAADRQGFPCHHTGDGVADLLAVGVHHPGHNLCVRPDIGCGYILIGADQGENLRGVASGQPLKFRVGQLFRRDGHASLGPAVGQPGQSAFPRHPHGECGDLAEVDVGMVADTAFGRAARGVMLHAVSGEDLDVIVIHPDGNADDERTLGLFEPLAQVVIQVHRLCRLVKLGDG